jgi:hypothetical protein
MGEHQLLGEALAQRMRRAAPRAPRRCTLVAKFEGEVVAVLDRLEPPLLQAAPLGAQQVVGHTSQRLAIPQRECLGEQARAAAGSSARSFAASAVRRANCSASMLSGATSMT